MAEKYCLGPCEIVSKTQPNILFRTLRDKDFNITVSSIVKDVKVAYKSGVVKQIITGLDVKASFSVPFTKPVYDAYNTDSVKVEEFEILPIGGNFKYVFKNVSVTTQITLPTKSNGVASIDFNLVVLNDGQNNFEIVEI